MGGQDRRLRSAPLDLLRDADQSLLFIHDRLDRFEVRVTGTVCDLVASLLATVAKLLAQRVDPEAKCDFFVVHLLLVLAEFAAGRVFALLAAAPPHVPAELGLVRAAGPVEVGLIHKLPVALSAHFDLFVVPVALFLLVQTLESLILLGQLLGLERGLLQLSLKPVELLCRTQLVAVEELLQRLVLIFRFLELVAENFDLSL